MKKGCIIPAIIFGLLFILAGYVYYAYYWELADGTKTGQVNFIVRKGYVFKTYEGRLIQAGLKSKSQSIASNEFDFSIEDDSVAHALELVGEAIVTVHYREYNNALPWRGYSANIVDKIVKVVEQPTTNNIVNPTNSINGAQLNLVGGAEGVSDGGLTPDDDKWYE